MEGGDIMNYFKPGPFSDAEKKILQKLVVEQDNEPE